MPYMTNVEIQKQIEKAILEKNKEIFALKVHINILSNLHKVDISNWLRDAEKETELYLENERLRSLLESIGICPDCQHSIAIRNPTGKCDHLYYPEYKNTRKVKQ